MLVEKPVILFDGSCVLCSASMRFVMAKSPPQMWRFMPLQSHQGRELAAELALDPDDPASLALLNRTKVCFKSEAVLTIAAAMPAPWAWLTCLRIIPASILDKIYDVIARSRYRFAGRRVCVWHE